MRKMKPTTYYSLPTTYSSSRGFSLLEVIIFSAIFSVIMVSFITILVAVTRVQTRQQAAAEVNQQSQFLLQQIQYYVERSSLIELSQDVATSTLKLRMPASAEDPTYIYLSGSTLYLQKTATGTAQALNSSKVNVSSLNFFVKRANPPGHDSVSVSFTVAYNTASPQQKFSQTLQTAIARVSAATFDSNVIPSSTATYKLGVSGNTWSSINDIINFSGSNVGIGTASPGAALEVSGTIRAAAPVASNDLATKAYVDAAGGSASTTLILTKIGTSTDAASIDSTLFGGQQYIWDNRASFGAAGTSYNTYTQQSAGSICYGACDSSNNPAAACWAGWTVVTSHNYTVPCHSTIDGQNISCVTETLCSK